MLKQKFAIHEMSESFQTVIEAMSYTEPSPTTIELLGVGNSTYEKPVLKLYNNLSGYHLFDIIDEIYDAVGKCDGYEMSDFFDELNAYMNNGIIKDMIKEIDIHDPHMFQVILKSPVTPEELSVFATQDQCLKYGIACYLEEAIDKAKCHVDIMLDVVAREVEREQGKTAEVEALQKIQDDIRVQIYGEGAARSIDIER